MRFSALMLVMVLALVLSACSGEQGSQEAADATADARETIATGEEPVNETPLTRVTPEAAVTPGPTPEITPAPSPSPVTTTTPEASATTSSGVTSSNIATPVVSAPTPAVQTVPPTPAAQMTATKTPSPEAAAALGELEKAADALISAPPDQVGQRAAEVRQNLQKIQSEYADRTDLAKEQKLSVEEDAVAIEKMLKRLEQDPSGPESTRLREDLGKSVRGMGISTGGKERP